MIGWIRRFFCPHDWEVMTNHQVEFPLDKSKQSSYTWILVQRCKKCGKVQKNIITVK